MPKLAGVVAREMKTAVDHHLYSTVSCAGVYAHEGSIAQMAKYSVSDDVTVFVPPNILAVHLSASIQKHAAVSAQTVPKDAPSLLSVSIQKHAAVSAHTVPKDAPFLLSASIQKHAAVSAQTVTKDAPSLLKFLTHALANASAPKYSLVLETSNLIHVHAVVSVLTLDLSAQRHKSLTQPAVSVNVQIGQSDAPTHCKSLMNSCADVGVPMLE